MAPDLQVHLDNVRIELRRVEVEIETGLVKEKHDELLQIRRDLTALENEILGAIRTDDTMDPRIKEQRDKLTRLLARLSP